MKKMRKQEECEKKMTQGNKPEKKFAAGAIQAVIWKNSGTKDGKQYEFQTISLERRYKDRDGNWQSTNSMRTNDLPKAELVLRKAYEYLNFRDYTQEDAQKNNQAQQQQQKNTVTEEAVL